METTTFQLYLDQAYETVENKEQYIYNFTVNQLKFYPEIESWDDAKKVRFLLFMLNGYTDYESSHTKEMNNYNSIRTAFVKQMMRGKLNITDEEAQALVKAMPLKNSIYGALYWPVGALIGKIEKKFKKTPVTPIIHQILDDIRAILQDHKAYGAEEKSRIKLIETINGLLYDAAENKPKIRPVFFPGNDDLKVFADEKIAALPAEERDLWYPLIQKAGSVSGSKPSGKYLKETKEIIDKIGTDKFKEIVHSFFEFVAREKIKLITGHYKSGAEYSYHDFLNSMNLDVIKGFVWMCSDFQDNRTIQLLAAMAEKSFQKIPGKGPAAGALGNACMLGLYESRTMEGIAQLSRLKLRIKQNNTQSLIEGYLRNAAAEKNMTIHEIEDLAVDDFDLVEGARSWDFEGYKAELKITGIGKTELSWYKPDGTPQKSVPSFVKEKHAAELKEIKAAIKQIELTVSAQRDRLDRMFRSTRKLNWENFQKLYIQHGLMGYITQKLIWKFETEENTVAVILLDGNWTTSKNEIVHPSENTQVSLWHPALCTVAEIKEWRDFLMEHKLQQPVKQAYREVYWLTDAEVNTKIYSNRMAAHILKQHQFNSLAKIRGWSYSLMGAYDDGISNSSAVVQLPDYGLRAEFWLNEVNMDGAYNDTGIWDYVATDQVRFLRGGTVVELEQVEPVAFSEVMRDVDLFVGVASVGNDPTWQDRGGVQVYRDYWQTYSFGDLSEVAKTRKEILKGLIPRLKIAKVTELTDKFVVVKGKLRTYKIHIGSTNILMEPNDQYLCIVADRGKKNPTEKLFLPFEGDNVLSIVLSKAFLLADDDKITDTTITSQINRN